MDLSIFQPVNIRNERYQIKWSEVLLADLIGTVGRFQMLIVNNQCSLFSLEQRRWLLGPIRRRQYTDTRQFKALDLAQWINFNCPEMSGTGSICLAICRWYDINAELRNTACTASTILGQTTGSSRSEVRNNPKNLFWSLPPFHIIWTLKELISVPFFLQMPPGKSSSTTSLWTQHIYAL